MQPGSYNSGMADDRRGTQASFERGLQVLVSVAERGQVTVGELANELGVPISTVYRYVRSLRHFGFLEEESGSYWLGSRLLALSGQHLTHTRLTAVSSSVLHDIVEATSETAVLTVRVGTQAMCLRQVESPHPIRYAFRINQLLPLHAGAGQRVLLAYAPAAVIQRVVDSPLPRYTGHTRGRDLILRDLDAIRSARMVVSHGELSSGAIAVAIPVFCDAEVVCALTVAGPESRCSASSWVAHIRKVLHNAGEVLSDALTRN